MNLQPAFASSMCRIDGGDVYQVLACLYPAPAEQGGRFGLSINMPVFRLDRSLIDNIWFPLPSNHLDGYAEAAVEVCRYFLVVHSD